METYFAKTYPIRLEDLKKTLYLIGEELLIAIENDDEKTYGELGVKFANELKKFGYNTKLHIVGLKEKKSINPLNVHMCSPQYIYEFLGKETTAGKLMRLLYEEFINTP